MPPIERCQPAKRFHFSLRTLFWWQLVLVPAFLAPMYVQMPGRQNLYPYIGLVLFIMAPVCYSALLVLWAGDVLDRQRFPILAAVRRGALFGALFGLLAWGLVWLPHLIEPIARLGELRYAVVRSSPWHLVLWTLSDSSEWLVLFGFLLLNYGVFGAATGGVIGIMRDLLIRHRIVRTLNPEP